MTPGSGDRERGTATAELAVVLPAVVLLALLGIWSVLLGAAQLRCVDAAGVGARAVARGEPVEVVRAVVAEVAPAGSRVEIGRDGDRVVVQVRTRVRLPWPGSSGGVELGDRAVAWSEETAR